MSNDRLSSKNTDSESSIHSFTPPDTTDSETQTVLRRLPRPVSSHNVSPSIPQGNADVPSSTNESMHERNQEYVDLATSRALLDYIFSENIEDTETNQKSVIPKQSTYSLNVVTRNSEEQLIPKLPSHIPPTTQSQEHNGKLSRNPHNNDSSSIYERSRDGDDQYPSLFNFLVNPSAINFFTESNTVISDDEKSDRILKQDISGKHKPEKKAKRVESWDSNLNFIKFVTSKSLINFLCETDNLCDFCDCESKNEISEAASRDQKKKPKKVHFYDDGFQSEESQSQSFIPQKSFQEGQLEMEKEAPATLPIKEPQVQLQYRNKQYSNYPISNKALQGDSVPAIESKQEIGHEKNHPDFASSRTLLDSIFSDNEEEDSTNCISEYSGTPKSFHCISEYSGTGGAPNESHSVTVSEKASNNHEFYITLKAEGKATSNHKMLDMSISHKAEEMPNQEENHISKSDDETPNYEVDNFSDDKPRPSVAGGAAQNKGSVTKTNPIANDIQTIYDHISGDEHEEKTSEFHYIINPCTVSYHNQNIKFGDGAQCFTDSIVDISDTKELGNEAEKVQKCEGGEYNFVNYVTINFHEAEGDDICHIHQTTRMLGDIISGDHADPNKIPRKIKPFPVSMQSDIAQSNELHSGQSVDDARSCVEDLESESSKSSESEEQDELHEEEQEENEITHFNENQWKVEEWLKRNRLSNKLIDIENDEESYGAVLTNAPKSTQHLIKPFSNSSDGIKKHRHKVISHLKETLDLARQQQVHLVTKLNSLNFPWRQPKCGVAKWVKESDASWRPKKPKSKWRSKPIARLFFRNTERCVDNNYETISHSESQNQILKPHEDVTVSNIGDVENSEILSALTLTEQVKDAVGQIKKQISVNTTAQIIKHGDTNQGTPNEINPQNTNRHVILNPSKLNTENSLDEINRLTSFLRKHGRKTKKHHTIFSLKELPSEVSIVNRLNFLQKMFKNFSRLWGFRRFGRRTRRVHPTISDEDDMHSVQRNQRLIQNRRQQQIRLGFLRRLFQRLRNYFTSTRNQHSGILHGIQRFETLQNSIRSRALPVMNEADIATHLFHRPHVCPLRHMRHCRNNTRSF